MMSNTAICRFAPSLILPLCLILTGQTLAQDLSHRKSNLNLTVHDVQGNAVPDAILDVQMKQHHFKFGTQIRDRFISISESEFNSLSDNSKQNLLPNLSGMAVASASFESSLQNWESFGQASLALNSVTSSLGSKSLFVSDRNFNYSSARLFLDGLLTQGANYRFSVSAKLAPNTSGTVQMTIKRVDDSGTQWIDFPAVSASDQNWIEITGDYTHSVVGTVSQFFVFIKGPNTDDGLGDYYLDNFSIVTNPIPYTPVWQDVLNYRNAVQTHFNHTIPTTGLQWASIDSNGYSVPDAAVSLVQSYGLSVTGASVVWPRDRWPTPNRYRPAASPNASTFHTDLINSRLSQNGVIARYSDTGAGPTINEWKVLNEPIHNNYYQTTFANAGLYSSQYSALANFFIQARAVRPNSILSINEYGIINAASDAAAIEYRNLVNDLLALGAPIDQIGIQAHMSRNDISKADMIRRINILAETGLSIEITEFDSRDDANQISPEQQKIIFQDMLEAAFESTAVDGFIVWGFWDPGHWRGNGPLFDQNWNVKDEASPWFDLVRGQWMTNLSNQTVNADGEWSATDAVFKGLYDFTVTVDGQTQIFENYDLSEDQQFTLVVSESLVPPSHNIPAMGGLSLIILSVTVLGITGSRYRLKPVSGKQMLD